MGSLSAALLIGLCALACLAVATRPPGEGHRLDTQSAGGAGSGSTNVKHGCVVHGPEGKLLYTEAQCAGAGGQPSRLRPGRQLSSADNRPVLGRRGVRCLRRVAALQEEQSTA